MDHLHTSPLIQSSNNSLNFDFSKLSPIFNKFKNYELYDSDTPTALKQLVGSPSHKRIIKRLDNLQSNKTQNTIMSLDSDQLSVSISENSKPLDLYKIKNFSQKFQQINSFQSSFEISKHQTKKNSPPPSLELQTRKKVKKQPAEQGLTCSCKHSRCLKQYCTCFSKGQTCSASCRCVNCHNRDELKFKSQRNKENKGCTCKLTKCDKGYCDCFSRGVKCGIFCKCLQCENFET